jgi:TonB family protein
MTITLAHAALAIATGLFDGLWQGVLVVGVIWLGLRCIPKIGASTRYAIWLCALAALVLIPSFSAYHSWQSSSPVTQANTAAPMPSDPSPGASVPVNMETAATPVSTPVIAFQKPQIAISEGIAFAVALVWILVAVWRGVLLLLNFRELAAIRRRAQVWPAACDYPVFLSSDINVPIATGFLHPAVVLPISLIDKLDASALGTIVVHEVAHLRRYDVWTNAFARVAEALVAVNPVVWFVMRRLSAEREIACDDWVVAQTGTGDSFAETLLALASRARCRAPLAAPSAIGSRHSIVTRIERLLDSRPRHLRLSRPALGGALMLLALIALVAQAVSPVLAYAPQVANVSQPTATVVVQNQGGVSGCPVRNRAARLFLPDHTPVPAMGRFEYDPRDLYDMNAPKLLAKFGASKVATFNITIDAEGIPHNVVVLSAPAFPGMTNAVKSLAMIFKDGIRKPGFPHYAPAVHDCVPVASTLHGVGMVLEFSDPSTSTRVSPANPKTGRPRLSYAGCKLPPLQFGGNINATKLKEMLPAFVASMKGAPLDGDLGARVLVHVNAGGAVTSAAIIRSSGVPRFDDLVLTSARRASYPPTVSAGFTPLVGTMEMYSNCKSLPTTYAWTTNFSAGVNVDLNAYTPG